ncbi:MAG: class I SAM-dependent RNA methyltransferase, partial [Bacteroidetes bacterium]|nr:class I SAM-dependent RNA methyltransferase [Bacteroidota bacterium]
MGRRNKRKTIEQVEITTIAAEGKGLGRQDGKVVFVDYGIPGDVVDVRLTKHKKDYAEGSILRLIKPSELREDSFCKLFGLCGGCRWQHISYQQQITYKHGIVEESFRRIGKLTEYELQPILGCELTKGYRNKMEYTFSNQCWLTEEQIQSGDEIDRRALGFHVSGQ